MFVAFEEGPNCEGCPYRETSQGFAPALISDTDDVMFVAEALGKDEARGGRPLIGGAGRVFNRLMLISKIHRSQVALNNCVKCRPLKREPCPHCGGEGCERCDEKGWVFTKKYGDFVNATPTPGQVAECASRYLNEELDRFRGRIIVGLGNIALHYFTNNQFNVGKYRGSVFRKGNELPCERCDQTGVVARAKQRCPFCGGKKFHHVEHEHTDDCKAKCRRKVDRLPVDCDMCVDGKIDRNPKVCPTCKGGGTLVDKSNPLISNKLREDQLFYVTFHPAFLMRQQKMIPVVERDFKRIPGLWEEMKEDASEEGYEYYPGLEVSVPVGRVSVDIETRGGLDPLGDDAEIICIGISDGTRAMCLEPGDERVAHALSTATEVIGQNYSLYDAWWLWQHKAWPHPHRLYDTRFAGHLLNPDTPNDLATLAGEFATPPMRGYWKAQSDYKEHIHRVVCMDVDAAFRVADGTKERLAETGQTHIMENDIIPLCNALFDMRVGGWRVDKRRMIEKATVMQSQIDALRKGLPDDIKTEGQALRIACHLFDVLGLPQIDGRSTDKNSLATLSQRLNSGHVSVERLSTGERAEALEFIDRIASLRALSKVVSSFLKQRISSTGKIHPVLNPGGTATFRLSCSNPNAQQIPKAVRDIFLPDGPNDYIVSADLRQAEVITFLWFAEEWDALKKILFEGHDAHAVTAEIIGCQRDEAKTQTFALLYGEQPETTAYRLQLPLEDILALRKQYFAAMPGVQEYRTTMIQQAMSSGYVQSPFGVRRYIRPDRMEGTAANQVCNAPIQNVPAMVTRRALIGLHRSLELPARLLMQVHDELILTSPPSQLNTVVDMCTQALHQSLPEMLCPWGPLQFPVDVEVGPTWGNLSPWNPSTS